MGGERESFGGSSVLISVDWAVDRQWSVYPLMAL